MSTLPEITAEIVSDGFKMVHHFASNDLFMPSTCCFKLLSQVTFGLIAELFALMLPQHIKISITTVIKTFQFNEFYCICGCVCAHWPHLMSHLRSMHLPVFRVCHALLVSHLPINRLELQKLASLFRSDVLGSIEEQRDRIRNLAWLIKNIPRAPTKEPTGTQSGNHFTFPYLF